MTTTADMRYGRQGGRWLPTGYDPTAPVAARPAARRGTDATTCQRCGRSFRYTTTGDRPAPPTCGRVPCHARHAWRADEWAGRARMATARQAAGRPLDDLDHEALARHPARPEAQAS